MIEVLRHDDVQRIRMWTRRSTVVGYDVSAYLVDGILIDTGFSNVRGELESVLRELRPRGVIVTHWHEDHAGNAPTLAASRMPMWISGYTEAKLHERPRLKAYRHWTWGRPAGMPPSIVRFDPAPLHVTLLPGHSPDHHVVFDANTRTLFSADLWLGVKVRIMAESENPFQIIQSLNRAIALEPRRMFDAHRGLLTNPIDALSAKKAWLEDTVGAVMRRLAAGDSEQPIVKEVLGGEEPTAIFTQGEYSRRNFVRAVRASAAKATANHG
jgi:glyoxylase-like metal-dependent hydrolase (beta-lactamase superfamily II)